MGEMSSRVLFAARDRRLEGMQLRVLLILETRLHTTEFRRVKTSVIAHEIYYDPEHPRHLEHWRTVEVARHIRHLHALGYVETGQRDGKFKTYRLSTPAPIVGHRPTKSAR